MHIVILSHERSLNKAEGLLNSYKDQKVTIVTDFMPDEDYKPYVKFADRIVLSKSFDAIHIVSKIDKVDKIWCVSENLLPIQSQLESYYGIENLSPFAAEVLSNKQKFDDYCRQIGLANFIPRSTTPTFHKQLDVFNNTEFFTKPDIGTGSNVFFPGDDQNTPNIEYRRWNNKHHFLKHLKDKSSHNDFFSINKQGILTERFNFKPCRIMAQEYHWSKEPSIAPTGFVYNGKVNTVCYMMCAKVKYGDILDYNYNPIELHSNSKKSDIAKDMAVYAVDTSEIDADRHISIQTFLQTVIDKLGIKELFFAGPDFHITKDKLIAIDFNPRLGQFINILDKVNNYNIVKTCLTGEVPILENKLLWGCSMLQPGKIKSYNNIAALDKVFNQHNTKIVEGMIIPEFQNLQNKSFNVNLDIIGGNVQELFTNYKQANQLLQNCITY
jgi:hypothetical protein